VDSVTETPTEPLDYALLTVTYGGLLGSLLLAVRSRGTAQPVGGAELVPLSVATFALAKLVAHEKVETWLREPFVAEQPGGERRPKGRGLRYAVGELMTCSRCLGAWSALGLVGLRTASPDMGRTVIAVLAASGANDYLQTGFSWACGKANQAQADQS
jgi:hypothetical protein